MPFCCTGVVAKACDRCSRNQLLALVNVQTRPEQPLPVECPEKVCDALPLSVDDQVELVIGEG